MIVVIAMTSTISVEPASQTSCPAEGVLVKTDSKGRLRVSREQRKAVLAKFEQSGMSAAKFAAVTVSDLSARDGPLGEALVATGVTGLKPQC